MAWNYFVYEDGSNPYITRTNKALWDMVKKYYLLQVTPTGFFVGGLREWNGKPKYTRDVNRAILRNFAQDWQANFSTFEYSLEDLASWGDFFTEYGRKFGMLRGFRENGIC